MTAPAARPAAVLWDMDGTLIDSEPYWFAAERTLVERWGGTWDDEAAQELVGNDLLVSGQVIRDRVGIDASPAEIVDMLVEQVATDLDRSLTWRPGARELLEAVTAAHIPCALVTMSYRRLVEPLLAATPAGTFGAVVTGDEVSRGKPDPEPYLRAAQLLGVDANDCVAIEDSTTGSRSAVAAGCRVIVVPGAAPVDPPEGARLVDSLAGLTLDDLIDLTA